jgi:hypothetical protein
MDASKPFSRRHALSRLGGLTVATGASTMITSAQSQMPDHLLAAGGITARHPEKTYLLGQVFNDTTNSYKLVWFRAILSLTQVAGKEVLTFIDLLTEMVVAAWPPVCLYRLSLGRQDKLQELVLEIQEMSGLPSSASPQDIRKVISTNTALKTKLEYFRRYVPTRFLAPWFVQELRGERDDDARTRKTMVLAHESQTSPVSSLYYFAGDGIKLNESWRNFLLDNLGVILDFTEHNFALYLQARNPNVPGVVNKLAAPTTRKLTGARDFWRAVRAAFERENKIAFFHDIYSGRSLDAEFSIDHFLPWSFVVHDLIWNLAPVEPTTNSSKNDDLPDIEIYLPRLAKIHFNAIQATNNRPKLLEDYTDCFKQDVAGLTALDEQGLAARFRDVMLPQAQMAINQGFRPGWRHRQN